MHAVAMVKHPQWQPQSTMLCPCMDATYPTANATGRGHAGAARCGCAPSFLSSDSMASQLRPGSRLAQRIAPLLEMGFCRTHVSSSAPAHSPRTQHIRHTADLCATAFIEASFLMHDASSMRVMRAYHANSQDSGLLACKPQQQGDAGQRRSAHRTGRCPSRWARPRPGAARRRACSPGRT